MTLEETAAAIEAILYVSGDPVELSALSESFLLTNMELESALAALEDRLIDTGSGLKLNRSGGTAWLSIRPDCAPAVEKFLQPAKKQALSQAVMETLSIIAYRQPVTKPEIEAVRGVKCDYSIQSLLNKGFIEEAGRKEALGRPMLYKTTDLFLSHLGIESLSQLPPPEAPRDEVET